ncbi:hypothetical protein HYDPIDRAFT_27983 [Hydnomerulius pinastri MD-312]|uniref:Uncharacterized protein n=1 Tax=Hydnomerulius pinastri MD-312 TaxID=994086 RepID=A0A0C9W2K8_9AGAM|nr:hypothetical protein HYDPIDRAFT_27983 [Hydnomerulius pinastri MD-312]
MFEERFPWTVAMPWKVSYTAPSPMSWAWYTPRYDHFVIKEGNTLQAGTLTKPNLEGLASLHELVKQCHCNYALAFPDDTEKKNCATSVENRWLGAFTTVPTIANQLYAAGVAIWFIRRRELIPDDIIITNVVKVWRPDNVVMTHYTDPVKGFASPFPVRWCGPGGYTCQYIVRCYNHTDGKADQFLPTTQVDKQGPVVYRSKESCEGWQPYPKGKPAPPAPPTTQAKSRDKWDVLQHALLPPRISFWAHALQWVKKLVEKGDIAPSTNLMPGQGALRFPDLAGFMTILSPDSARQNLANWLAIWTAWIARVVQDPAMCPPSLRDWHLFLNSTPADILPPPPSQKETTSAAVKREAVKVFGEVLPTIESGSTWAGDDTVKFQEHTAHVFTTFPILVTQSVLWELADLSFQYDLLVLDQHLLPDQWRDHCTECEELWHGVFSSAVIGDTWDAPLPMSNAGVFHRSDMRGGDFLWYLNAFAQFLSAWPGAPAYFAHPLTSAMTDTILTNSCAKLMIFYIKTFFVHSGRPPVVPHRLPGSARA